MKKPFVTILFFLAVLFLLPAGEYVVSTEHFDFIYSEKTEESAAEIIGIAEECYEKLVSFFGTDPDVRFPVYFESGVKQYNAHYTGYTSAHIVMYVTSVTPELFANTRHSFRLTFLHELTHAFTSGISNGFVRGVRSVFGDWIAPGELYLDQSFIEGIAVFVESMDGEGRLNDPYSMALISEISAEGFPFTSHSDIAGGLDISPGGNLSYIAGASFLKYLARNYSSESVASFIRSCYLFPISTTGGIFKKVFGVSIKDAWNGYIESQKLPFETRESRNVSGWGSWNNLTFDSGTLYVKDAKTGSLYSIESGSGRMKRIAFSYSSPDDLSFSPSYILSPYVGQKERRVSLLDRRGKTEAVFDDYYTGLLLSDEKILLVTESDRDTVLSLFSLPDRTLLTSWELGRDITLSEGVALDEKEGLFVLTKGGKTGLLHVDTESGELLVIGFPDDIYIHSLSANEDGTLAFSYIEKDGFFTKYGEYDPDGGIYTLSSDNFTGGVYYPVKSRDGIITYVSKYIYSTTLSSVDASSLSMSEKKNVTEEEFGMEESVEKSLEGIPYNPLRFMKKAAVMPLSVASGRCMGDLSGLGVMVTTIDPSEKHTLISSFGYSFDTKAPTMFLSYAYSEYFKTTFAAFSYKENTYFESDWKVSYTKNLGSYNRSLTLCDTLSFCFLPKRTGLANLFKVSYQDAVPMGIGRYEVLGWGITAELENLSPSAYASLYLPHILPFSNTTHLGCNMPFRISWGVNDMITAPVMAFSGKLYLLTWEIQKSVNWLSVYLQHLDLTLTYGGELSFGKWSYSDVYTLALKLSLTPLIGRYSSVAVALNACVRYTSDGGFRPYFTLSLGDE